MYPPCVSPYGLAPRMNKSTRRPKAIGREHPVVLHTGKPRHVAMPVVEARVISDYTESTHPGRTVGKTRPRQDLRYIMYCRLDSSSGWEYRQTRVCTNCTYRHEAHRHSCVRIQSAKGCTDRHGCVQNVHTVLRRIHSHVCVLYRQGSTQRPPPIPLAPAREHRLRAGRGEGGGHGRGMAADLSRKLACGVDWRCQPV